jgi:hypothetical protein
VLTYRAVQHNKAPNVWQQLLKRCKRSPACLRVCQQELEQELAAAHKGDLKLLLLLLLLLLLFLCAVVCCRAEAAAYRLACRSQPVYGLRTACLLHV